MQPGTGTLLGLHYTPGTALARGSVVHVLREVYYGSVFRLLHSSGASLVFLPVLVHVYRGVFHGSYMYVSGVLVVGTGVYGVLMAIAFMGYVLPWGPLGYWGATVITALGTGVPCMVPWFRGSTGCIGGPTLCRYYIIHSILPVPVPVLLVFHVVYIHRISSSSSTGYNTNTRVHFYTWLVYKDTLVVPVVLELGLVQVYQGIVMLAHPDNSLEVSVLFTPLHIVPE